MTVCGAEGGQGILYVLSLALRHDTEDKRSLRAVDSAFSFSVLTSLRWPHSPPTLYMPPQKALRHLHGELCPWLGILSHHCPLLTFVLHQCCSSDCLLWGILHLYLLSYHSVPGMSPCDYWLFGQDWPWTQALIAFVFQVQDYKLHHHGPCLPSAGIIYKLHHHVLCLPSEEIINCTTMPGWFILILIIHLKNHSVITPGLQET